MSFYQLPKNLSDLDHFRSNPMVQFKDENVGGLDIVIPCYMIADADFWKQPFALELRGHVFRKDTGELISAALPKFFNVGENEYTQKHNLPWDAVCSIMDKRDGSMLTPCIINGKIYWKTKKSFYSDVAIIAQKWWDERIDADSNVALIKEWAAKGVSPVYEFWHPEWQIVLNYGDEPSMFCLGYRDMNTSAWIPLVGHTPGSIDEVINFPGGCKTLEEFQETAEGVKGYVIQFADGRVVKAKTKWYLQQHRVRTDLRERDIAELAALEKLDDVKSVVSEAGMDMSLVENIERRVAISIAAISCEVKALVAEARKAGLPTPKEVAVAYKSHPHFGMIMREWRRKGSGLR